VFESHDLYQISRVGILRLGVANTFCRSLRVLLYVWLVGLK